MLVVVAFLTGVGSTTLAQSASSTVTLRPGESVLVVAEDVVTPPPTTVPPTTTSTVPPTTSTTTTTAPPTTTTTTTVPPTTSGFVETFDNNTGLDRFDFGVWHRDGPAGGTVSADHDLNCGDPSTQRTVRGNDPASSFYVCRDHLMTAVGDWSGYSVGWFSPKQTFTTERTVSWDVNVTNLGGRQWWEVMVVPAAWNSGFPGCEHCAVQHWLSPDPAHLPGYPAGSIVVGSGAFGNDVNIHTGSTNRYTGWQKVCGAFGHFQSSGACASKMTRIPFKVTENANNTITVNYGGAFSQTFPGQFPNEPWVVVFKDHNYTPDKDGRPAGHTWHWDSIVVK